MGVSSGISQLIVSLDRHDLEDVVSTIVSVTQRVPNFVVRYSCSQCRTLRIQFDGNRSGLRRLFEVSLVRPRAVANPLPPPFHRHPRQGVPLC
jgi:hypothetical protein